jgi:hypothetical protein
MYYAFYHTICSVFFMRSMRSMRTMHSFVVFVLCFQTFYAFYALEDYFLCLEGWQREPLVAIVRVNICPAVCMCVYMHESDDHHCGTVCASLWYG